MIGSLAVLGFLTVQRAIELAIATRHTRALLARGAYEVGAEHYPVMVSMHAAWLLTLWIFGWNRALVLPFVIAFAILQLGRLWVLRTLGERWTTRIVVVPDESPIVTGPFRYVRHPNYLVVALEIPCVPLALGLVWHAVLFGTANLAMLAWRIRSENRAYARFARS